MEPKSKDEFFDLPVQRSHAEEDTFISRMFFCIHDARLPTECPNFEIKATKSMRPRPTCATHQNERMSWGDIYTAANGEPYRFHL